ncbi:hypothetical protein ACVWZZ_008531 [Bradyrhizobium sp. LM6.10]
MRKPCKKAAKRFKTVRRVAVRCDENSSEQTLRAPNTRCDSGEKNEVPTVQRVSDMPPFDTKPGEPIDPLPICAPCKGTGDVPGPKRAPFISKMTAVRRTRKV